MTDTCCRLLAIALLLWSGRSVADGVSGAALVAAAREQIGVTVRYDPSYTRLAYPGGDVDLAGGVCTDVVIRAYRRLGVDLQVLVHQDMRRTWDAYPKLWGLRGPDSNIDHRRVPNLAVYFARHGATLALDAATAAYVAGDLVTWRLPSGVPHVGIVSDRLGAGDVPLIVHNIGAGAREEDVLHAYTITGHYRFAPPTSPR